MRIIIATPFARAEDGVLGMYASELAAALKRRGDIVMVVSYGRLEHVLPMGLRHILYFCRLLPHLTSYDIILALDTWSVGLPASLAARLLNTMFGMRIGGDIVWESYVNRTRQPVRLSEFYQKPRALSLKERIIHHYTGSVVRTANVLFFNARFLMRIWQDEYKFSDAHAKLLENYYPERNGEPQPATGKVFVSAGRAIALKNYEALQRAFERVKRNHPEITLDMRKLPPSEHRARLRTAYAVIIPSVSEVSSNTAIDAVAAGKPFIMTSDTGTKDRLGDCGLFIDTRSEDELAWTIEAILNPETYTKLESAARAFSFTRTWDDIAADIAKAFGH